MPDSREVDLERALEVARGVARDAGHLLQQGRQQGFEIENKGEVDLVTEHDRRSEALVVEALSRAFPHHTVVGEEGTEIHAHSQREDRSGPVWLVDPLDGTTNYAHRLPWYSVSIGLELDGTPVLGVVVAPEMGWEFWAAAGHGAWLNDQRLEVSRTPDLDRSLVATGFPYDRRTSPDNNVPQFATVIRRCQGVRRIGVASLDCALVAWGLLDAYWEPKLKAWDISGGAALVLEAGGQVTLLDGGPFRSEEGDILATNGLVHQEMISALAEAKVPGPSIPV
jgi:myo-inositol-1(or 4)-monophosphatase